MITVLVGIFKISGSSTSKFFHRFTWARVRSVRLSCTSTMYHVFFERSFTECGYVCNAGITLSSLKWEIFVTTSFTLETAPTPAEIRLLVQKPTENKIHFVLRPFYKTNDFLISRRFPSPDSL